MKCKHSTVEDLIMLTKKWDKDSWQLKALINNLHYFRYSTKDIGIIITIGRINNNSQQAIDVFFPICIYIV